MGSTHVSAPQTPAAPTTTSSIEDYVKNYPTLFAMNQQYAPQEAAQQIALAQQYAQPYGQAMKTAQEAMYPEQTKITNTLLQQAQEGMSSQVPSWMQDQYRSEMNAQLGSNAGSPIGADYMSRGLLQQQQDWQKYYQNMGLSLSGSQPIYQATQPTTTNQTSTFTPASVMGYNSSNYGNYIGAYGSMYGANAGLQANANNINQKYIGSGMAMVGAMSSNRYKTNIKLWE